MPDSDDPMRLKRRLLVLKGTALGALAGTAQAQGPKSGMRQPPAGGITDADPQDPPNQGRGGSAPRPGGVTDADPQDPPGQGRGGRGPQKPA